MQIRFNMPKYVDKSIYLMYDIAVTHGFVHLWRTKNRVKIKTLTGRVVLLKFTET